MDGILYICGTPIGNLEDMTLRAIRVLKEVHLIAAEDTRQTQKLLERYEITTPMTSCHEHNIKEKTPYLLKLLEEGKSIALVSDAGMPGISDPGYELIQIAIEQNIKVVPIPGPTAAMTALAISGLPTDLFVFEGFLPHNPTKRRRVLRRLVPEKRTIIIYESPHRITKTLADIKNIFGDREICIARELTKKFEEILRGKVSNLILKIKQPMGEYTIVIAGET